MSDEEIEDKYYFIKWSTPGYHYWCDGNHPWDEGEDPCIVGIGMIRGMIRDEIEDDEGPCRCEDWEEALFRQTGAKIMRYYDSRLTKEVGLSLTSLLSGLRSLIYYAWISLSGDCVITIIERLLNVDPGESDNSGDLDMTGMEEGWDPDYINVDIISCNVEKNIGRIVDYLSSLQCVNNITLSHPITIDITEIKGKSLSIPIRLIFGRYNYRFQLTSDLPNLSVDDLMCEIRNDDVRIRSMHGDYDAIDLIRHIYERKADICQDEDDVDQDLVNVERACSLLLRGYSITGFGDQLIVSPEICNIQDYTDINNNALIPYDVSNLALSFIIGNPPDIEERH